MDWSESARATHLNLDALARWLDERGLGEGPFTRVVPLGGGTQNTLLRLQRAGLDAVLRSGPEHPRPQTNKRLRAEMRVVAALDGTPVPHPRLIASCTDESVLDGSVFYLMEPVEGVNATVTLSPIHAQSAPMRRQMGLAAADALAAISHLDFRALGLADLGRPGDFLGRQVGRWRSELASYGELDGFESELGPAAGTLGDWLDAYMPPSWTPGLMHGDFQLANFLYRTDSPAIAAVVDWEMATIGDPLLDLGWLLVTWPEPGRPDIFDSALGATNDTTTVTEIAEHYAAASDHRIDHLDWYQVLAAFKLAIVLEGTHARASVGLAPTDVGDRLHAMARALMHRALWIAK